VKPGKWAELRTETIVATLRAKGAGAAIVRSSVDLSLRERLAEYKNATISRGAAILSRSERAT
jgi:hypothetical protein